MAVTTPDELLPLIAAGAQVEVRDEEWLVRQVQPTPADGLLVRCIGTSTLVRDTEASFFTKLDQIIPLRPEDTTLVQDDSPNFRTSRLYLEAILRKAPIPTTNTDLAVSQHQLLDRMEYQRRAVHKALTGLRPRLLIADAVGLGKTLEVGMILSELIRRGQGDRILVVTPRHILEQFQHELWTRFAIPLVRLDSEGIQRVRRQIPANRNPFTYYKRSIISIDTLKNTGRYRHHLEGIRWDAVVIDECHNLVNRGTLNNQLARTLAPRTEALLLTSATPHNGDPDSFAELIRLLDPTAIADPSNIRQSDIEHLYVRRHKAHEEVSAEVGSQWADRKEPRAIPVTPTPPEEAMFAELADTWTHPVSGSPPVTGKGKSLFPWTLFKSALSSHHALIQTVEQRRKTLASKPATEAGLSMDQRAEDTALSDLLDRAAAVTDETSSKLIALVEQLREIGVGPKSKTRVVIFSERIATLDWLAASVPGLLGLKPGQHLVLHGGLADVKQMDVIEQFGLADTKVRLLFTGDMASEGVNLHRQCHHLIHFDLPWSLITIEQRNGRIDRYGQLHSPDIRALVQTPDHDRLTGDVRILTKLLQREQQAHRAFGESGSLLGLHNPGLEEESVMKSLSRGDDVETVIPEAPQKEFDILALIAGSTGLHEVPVDQPPTLFESDLEFVREAMDAAFDDPTSTLEIRTEVEHPDLLSIRPPKDLLRRLGVLPQSYISEQKISERLKLTGDSATAEQQLVAARESSSSSWPEVGHLSPLHPLTSWLADKVLVELGRHQAPVLKADVASPVFCVQGQFSNGRGQPQLVEWMAVFPGPSGALMVDDLFSTLERAGVGPAMPNDGLPIDVAPLAAQLDDVVAAARAELHRRRDDYDTELAERLAEPTERLQRWLGESEQLTLGLEAQQRDRRHKEHESVRVDTERLIESTRTTGEPLVRLGLAFDRNDSSAKGELETIAALFSSDALVPVDGQSALETLVDKSFKHAVGVSKELRAGIRESIEILANEVIAQRDARARASNQKLFTRSDVDARDLTRQSLRYLYRLIVLLYAESRPELGIVPADDEDYIDGYSLDRLRELCLVELDDDHARNGSHFQQSLDRLFELVNGGYHADSAEQQLLFTPDDDASLDDNERRSDELYIQFPGLDAQLFTPESTGLLNAVPLRNEALQQVLRKLMLAPGKRAKDAAGFISYAQLGINQLGAVYEGLMAYTGFYAHTDLFEVAKGGDPTDGTWMLPVADANEYPDNVFVMAEDEVTGREQRVMHPQGSFVFRLSGRDRQRSASYYTPEVLTRCVVKHALAELLGLDGYAPENGSSGITNAVDLLDITICEPALGSGAFANEAINQLSAEYLRRREAELGEVLNPTRRDIELQKVKAHFALHQTYGVDLNSTAVELAEVSLWLNAMYPGLKAPWFGLQLRQGNSLVGCRRSTWRASQLGSRPWAQTKSGSVIPPVDRPLSEELESDEIHHFLLPGHGWAAVADRKEAKELRPDEVDSLKTWRKTVLKAPRKDDAKRLTALAAGVEAMWTASTALVAATQSALRRSIGVYGTEVPANRSVPISRQKAIAALNDENSPLGRLRTLMDAWIGLWFWPLDTGERPPSWNEWLAVAEDLIRPDERHGLTGQLDLFADLDQLLESEQNRQTDQVTVAELETSHPWFAIAVDAARREGAWHWELEFAPEFKKGGFDLQVGNPPWVRPIWRDDLVLAEHDPWWGVTEKPGASAIKHRRSFGLESTNRQRSYLGELASAEGIVETLVSPVHRPVLAGIQTNLYMAFMDTTWRNISARGIVGLIHPESHFTDPKASALRRMTYGHLRRHFDFINEMMLFEDVGHQKSYGIHCYGTQQSIVFISSSRLLHPDTIDSSLDHSGSGDVPGYQHARGGWDLRPHAARILQIDENVLDQWARLFDEPGTPASEARLLRPPTVADLGALSALADQPVRLADYHYSWTGGLHEKGAKTDGTIHWETLTPNELGEVILQGPHFSVANPFAKQPNEHCKSKGDYSEWNLEKVPEYLVPRTNYQRSISREEYESRLDHWDGEPFTNRYRHLHRVMTQPVLMRSVQGALFPPGPAHVHGVASYALGSNSDTVRFAGLMASIPIDYLFKSAGSAHVEEHQLSRIPLPPVDEMMSPFVLLRVMRLNCLTLDYADLWSELFNPSWQEDVWTDLSPKRSSLGNVQPTWSILTPLRRDQDRWQALVELDALAALMLGLSAEQLCAMYRTQFAVLRKYEYKMVFDAEGRKLCGYHQSAGFRQSQLQDQAKAGDLPTEWKNLWKLYEQYEADPESVDWLGHYTAPFTRVDREAAMTRAYNEFQRRLDDGEYDET